MNMLNTNLSIKHKGTLCRISHEFNNLMLQCNNVYFEYLNNEFIFSVTINNHKYKFILSSDYPFKPPSQIYYNNITYKKLVSTNTPKIQHYLSKMYGLTCLCCSSFLCGANWTPAITIATMINEINNTLKMKRDLLLYILCDTIKLKHKCEFAYIESYLI